MKKISIALLIAVVGLVSCEKDSSEVTTAINSTINASKTTDIKLGETVIFSLGNVDSSTTAIWSVTPNINTELTAYKTSASVKFTQAGSYTVTAKLGSSSINSTVSVNSTVYNPPITSGLTSFTSGEKIKITLIKLDSASTAASGIFFSAKTTNFYNCMNSYLVTTATQTGADYKIAYSGVYIPQTCSSGQTQPSGSNQFKDIAAGSHVFSVEVNGTVYTGSFIKTGTTYTFTWPNTTVVEISPLVL